MRSTKETDEVEARKFLQRWRDEEAAARNNSVLTGNQVRDKVLKMGRLLDEYVAANHPARGRIGRTKSASTLQRERRFIDPVREWWGEKNAHNVTLADCDQYREWRNSGGWITRQRFRDGSFRTRRTKGGDTAVDHELDLLSCAFHLARRNNLIRTHPLIGRGKYVTAEKVRHCRDCAPSRKELRGIERWLRARGEHDLADVVCFLAYSGLRIGEALKVRWEDVYWRKRVVAVKREKNGVNPWIAIVKDLKALLSGMRRRREKWQRETGLVSEYLFPSPFDPSSSRDASAVRHRLGAACKSLQIRHATPHGLRSYYVTRCREAKLMEADIAMLIGDKSGPAIIARTYGDVRDDHLLRQVKRVSMR